MRAYDFDGATAIDQVGDRWHATIAEGWDMGGVPNGGYQLSIASRAILAVTGRRDVVALSSSYLSPGHPGNVEIEVEVLPSRGKRHTACTATLRQDDTPTMVVQAISGELPDDGEQHLWETSPPPLGPPEQYPRLLPRPPSTLPPRLAEHVELRLPVEQVGFAFGKAHGAPTTIGWTKFPDDRPLDTLSLPLFVDAFPPAVFNTGGVIGWVPTLTLSIQIRRRPKGPWLSASFRSRFIDETYVEEDGELWDTDGTLVALSRQLALAPRGS
jgi:acyl-CoA thioesterase